MSALLVSDPDFDLHVGDVRDVLAGLPDESIDCVVTSPPYWNLRDYDEPGQLGREPTAELYVAELAAVFEHVRRVLKPAGVAWLNIGDSYLDGSLALVPAQLALALRANGWLIRADVIWHKPNAMPDTGGKTRPGADHEYVLMLAKQRQHFYAPELVRSPAAWDRWGDQTTPKYGSRDAGRTAGSTRGGMVRPRTRAEIAERYADGTKLLRATWSILTAGNSDAHFAVMPDDLAAVAILATCPAGGVVLDPFLGSGTTAYVARRLGRSSIGIELNAGYAELAARRMQQQSLLA